jgi:hypothetical protein
METEHLSGKFPKCRQKQNKRDKVGSFCVCKMNYSRNVGGNAFIRKYLYNNYNVEVNLGVTR